MINRRILLGSAALTLLAACASTGATEAPHQTYSAAAFFQTTSCSMGSPAGLGFSPDGRSIIISSDQSGVFNAYALSIEGGLRSR